MMAESIDLITSKRIRENVRRLTVSERLFHREIAVRKSRKNLEEVEEELKVLSALSPSKVSQLAAKIKQSCSIEDLRILKQSLGAIENISSLVRVVGAMQSIIGHLTGRKALHQLEAAYICCNMALGDEHVCYIVASAAGPYLIELLDSQNVALLEASAWCLGNLVGGSTKSLTLLRSQGLISQLTQGLKNNDKSAQEAIIYALCHTLKSSSSSSHLISAEEFQAIASLATELILKSNAVHWLIFLLSTSSHCDLIFLEKSVPTLYLDQMNQIIQNMASLQEDINELRSMTSMLRTVANISNEPSGEAALVILNHKATSDIMNALVHSSQRHLQLESRWFAMNLLHHPSSTISSAAHNIGLDKIAKLE